MKTVKEDIQYGVRKPGQPMIKIYFTLEEALKRAKRDDQIVRMDFNEPDRSKLVQELGNAQSLRDAQEASSGLNPEDLKLTAS